MKFPVAPKGVSNSITDRVYEQLRLSIITGKIPGRSRLVEASLAEELGVSRTPVREALQKLALEGLLYSIPRAGYIVEDLSESDIMDLFKTRTAIEQLAARWALQKISDAEIGLLKENLEKTDAILAGGETKKMIELDTEFHQIIYKASGSRNLYRISQYLSDHTLKFRIACIHLPEIAGRAREGHYRIYQALKSKDQHRVDLEIRAHLEVVQKDILEYIRAARINSF